MSLSIGFLGAGFISRTHRFFLKHCSVDHQITAVFDPDRPKAEAFAERRGASVVDESALLDSVDVVFVTAWTSEHERLVREAAERGVAVFCEKPLAADATAAARMAAAVENAGVASQVGLVLRFLPQFRWARQLLTDERAGRLMTIVFRDDQFIPTQSYYASDWRADPARAGRGTLLEHSIHDVDIISYIAGPIGEVHGRVREFHGLDRIDDLAVATMALPNDALASLTSIWHDMTDRPSQRHIELFAERLHVRLDGTPEGPVVWRYADGPEESLAGPALLDACLDLGLGRRIDALEFGAGAMFNPVTEFLETVRDGRPSPLPLSTALPAHEVVDRIYADADRASARST
ncbi:MAG: Gfo/Idh/MocA family oxidoreductase [Actinomycetota bacterium]